jgi:hypothetical protein
MDLSRAEDNYESELDARVRELVETGTANSFEELCAQASGAYPTEVFAALRRIEHTTSRSLGLYPNGSHNHPTGNASSFPEPHAVDYEWRFAEETVSRLASIALRTPGRTACLGTPTVYYEIADKRGDAVLYDRNPLWPDIGSGESQNIFHIDLCRHRPVGAAEFGLVLLDPPWYVGHMRAWISHALQLARVGGNIIMPIFQHLLRPGAAEERASLVSDLQLIGETFIERDAARYVVPPFERESLAVEGIVVSEEWRTADLIHVTKERAATQFRFDVVEEPEWLRFRIGLQTVALRVHSTDRRAIRTSSLYEDGSVILKSVSARDPVRREIGLWTSRNRCLRVTGAARIADFCALLQRGTPPRAAIGAIARDAAERDALHSIVLVIGI